MNVEQLKWLLVIRDAGSLVAASQHLDCDPSKLSRLLSAVESELGFRIFHRTTRSLSLTGSGEQYLDRIQPALEILDLARDEARELSGKASGHLRITASVGFGHVQIMPLIPIFRGIYPEITLECIWTDEVLDLVENRVDLAIRLGEPPQSDGIRRKLKDVVYSVCVSPAWIEQHGFVIDPRDLATHNCIRFDLPNHRTRWNFRELGNRNSDVVPVEIKGTLLIKNALSVRRASLEGLGPAMLADWLIEDQIKNGELVPLFPDYEVTATSFDTAIWALYPTKKQLPKKVRLFLDFLDKNL